MSRIGLLNDGSLLFESPPTIALKGYYQDPDNPLHFIPKFQPCTYRENKCRVGACSKTVIFLWTCSLKKIQVSTDICGSCNERKQG